MLKITVSGLPAMSARELKELEDAITTAIATVKDRKPGWKAGATFYSFPSEQIRLGLGQKILVEISGFGRDDFTLVPQDLAVTVGSAVHERLPQSISVRAVTVWATNPAGIYCSQSWDRSFELARKVG